MALVGLAAGEVLRADIVPHRLGCNMTDTYKSLCTSNWVGSLKNVMHIPMNGGVTVCHNTSPIDTYPNTILYKT